MSCKHPLIAKWLAIGDKYPKAEVHEALRHVLRMHTSG